jgi:hypothetical protein
MILNNLSAFKILPHSMDGGSADYCNEVAGKNPSQWGGVWKPQHKMITEVQTQVSVVLGLWSEVNSRIL